MVAGYSNRRYDSPTDLTGTTVTSGSRIIYIVDTRNSATMTTGTLEWPVEPTSYTSIPLLVPVADLKRQARMARLREELAQFKKDLLRSLRQDRALRAMRAAVPGKLPLRRHPLQRARHGFQQMCRIPCYRGVRTR